MIPHSSDMDPTGAGHIGGSATTVIAPPTHIPIDAPWRWLTAGWHDLWSVPHIGLTYGALFALAALLIIGGLFMFEAQALFPAFAGGYLIIAPFLGVGLYEASRRRAAGEAVTLGAVARAGLAARGQLAFFGVMLLLVFLIWLRIAFLLMMIFLGTSSPPPLDLLPYDLLVTIPGVALLVVGSIVGGLIAAVVFAMSVVAVPMLLVTRVDAFTAARFSVETVLANPKPMALWAALIAGLMVIAFGTWLVGLVVVFPLIAHATWHAYAETLGREGLSVA